MYNLFAFVCFVMGFVFILTLNGPEQVVCATISFMASVGIPSWIALSKPVFSEKYNR